jgi:hypothetical protein
MRTLYLNTDTGLLTATAGATSPVRRMDVKRGDLLELEVITSPALPAGATGLLVAKQKGIYSGDPVALDAAWEEPQTEGAGHRFALALSTAELDALFTAELAEVGLIAEITWTAAGKTRSTQTFDLIVARDVWRGDEALPSPATAPLSFTLSSPDESQWTITITNDGQIVATKPE